MQAVIPIKHLVNVGGILIKHRFLNANILSFNKINLIYFDYFPLISNSKTNQ